MKSVVLAASLLAAASLTAQSPIVTTMVGGLVLGSYAGSNTIYFDVTVLSPTGMIVQSFDLLTQLGSGYSLPGACNVFRTALGGTQTGNRTNPAVWTQVGAGTITATGTSVVTLNQPFALQAGTYGFAIQVTNAQAVYTNPATPVPPLPTSFSNADVTINCVDARTQNSTVANAFTGGVSAVRTPNLRMYYSTAPLVVNFTSSATSGNAPLAVNFTSTSLSTDPAGILAYAWDFDGDSVIDSTVQNPTYTYTNCGTYTVSLTCVDATGSLTTTKTNLVVVDPLAANFTWTKIADPAVFQFTNTSSSSAQTFAWDLDGDSVVDSTQPNPVFSYNAACGIVPVSLTVTNSCRTSTAVRQFVPLPGQTSLFNANNGGATGWGNFFDVTVTNPDGVSMCGVSMNLNDNGAINFTGDVYMRSGSYVGNDGNSAGWTLVGTGSGVSGGFNTPSTITFPSVYLAPGNYGFAVYVNGTGPAYSGTGTSPLPGAATYIGPDMTLSLGVARNGLFGLGATQYTPRIWNGTIHYETVAQGLAIHQVFGSGCAGSLGVPGNVPAGLPHLGQTFTATFTNLPQNVAFHMLGFSRTASLFGALPLDLTAFGAPGCAGRVSTDAVSLMIGAGNSATFSWTLPNDPSFLGARFYNQALALDTVNALGAITSDAAMLVLGL